MTAPVGVIMRTVAFSLLMLAGLSQADAREPACDGRPPPDVGDADLRLPPNADAPTAVRAGMFVDDLRDLDAVTASFRFRGILTITWCDPRLAFDAAAAGVDEKVLVGEPASVEIERIFFVRGFAVNNVEPPRITERVLRIASDGTISSDLNVSVLLRANYDLRRFPFDRQQLQLQIESFLWNADQLRFVPDDDMTGFADNFDIPEWKITGVRADVSTVDVIRSSEPFSRLTLTIDVQRKSGFYLWKVLLPLFIIVALSWSIFWMVDERFGIRVRTSATGILTVVAYQFVAGQDLPRVGYLTLIDKIMVISFLLLAITVLESYIVSRYGEDERDRAHRVDRTARWTFPLTYASLIGLAFLLTPG
jgi:hypothetical protein